MAGLWVYGDYRFMGIFLSTIIVRNQYVVAKLTDLTPGDCAREEAGNSDQPQLL